MNNFIFFALLAVIFGRALWLSFRRQIHRGLVSAITAIMYLGCLWVPAWLQEEGLIKSKLLKANVLIPPTAFEIDGLTLDWASQLLVVLLAELAVCLLCGAQLEKLSKGPISGSVLTSRRSKRVGLILVVIGLVVTVALRGPSLDHRADGGQGLTTILKSSLTVGLAYLAYNNFFRKNLYRLVAMLGVLTLIAASVRSPLLVVMFGYLGGLVSRRAITPPRIVQLVSLGLCLAIAAAFMSSVRAVAIRGGSADLTEILSDTLERPYVSVYESGIDTLDGYRLSQKIHASVPPDPLNILVAVTTFVPRALWPDKPTDLSVKISFDYLHYGQGGQFMSPIGYMWLAFGSYTWAVFGMFVFAVGATAFLLAFQNSFGCTIVICVLFRFMMGGSPFDIYYGLALLLPFSLAYFPVRLYEMLERAARGRTLRTYGGH